MIPPKVKINKKNTHRLIPSRYPTTGLFDDLVSPSGIDHIFELESWTNDRVNSEYGKLFDIPQDEWVYNKPNASVIMASFCHPSAVGGRFNGSDLGAWYSALSLETALREVAYHRAKELLEFTELKGKIVQMRQYLSDFREEFYDAREFPNDHAIYDSSDYTESQGLAERLKEINARGLIYRSVRHIGGECIVCYRPKSVLNVRQGHHFELKWGDGPEPMVRFANS
ncbi:MAG: hypothetical protein K0R73_1308 [Candidatus Midichloriaceae bacterium]|nr:hypothetical protein [Candidatus Midichloriaceae bacterium]